MDFEPFEYKNLNMTQIHDYMEEHATGIQKADFKKEVFTTKKKKQSTPVYDDNGKPVMYQVKKAGIPQFDADGNPIMKQKRKMTVIEESAETPSYSALEARKWFVDHFPEAVKNVPEKKEKVAKATELFANW